jgi:hypothetical protein
MRKQLPLPVVIAMIVLAVGGIFAILMQFTSMPGGAGDIEKIAAEIKSKEPPDFTPEQAQGDAMFRGEKSLSKSSTKGKK